MDTEVFISGKWIVYIESTDIYISNYDVNRFPFTANIELDNGNFIVKAVTFDGDKIVDGTNKFDVFLMNKVEYFINNNMPSNLREILYSRRY